MPALNSDWTVSRHGPLKSVTDGMLTVEGTIKMPFGHFPRRMTIVKLSSRRTAIWSAVSLEEQSMKCIEAEGDPLYLIVPNAHHRLDVRAWKARYPNAKVLAPDGARKAVMEACPVDGNQTAMADPDAALVVVDGTGDAEFALEVKRSDGTTLIVNDIIANVTHPRGVMAKLMARILGFGVREPQTPRVVKRMLVRDERALARQFVEWSANDQLRRIIPSHGEIITQPRQVLLHLARKMRA